MPPGRPFGGHRGSGAASSSKEILLINAEADSPLHGVPEAFAREQAGDRIAFVRENAYETQHWLRAIAHDHLLREEFPEALATFEEALRAGGPRDALVLSEVNATREMVLAQKRGDPIPRNFNLPPSSAAP